MVARLKWLSQLIGRILGRDSLKPIDDSLESEIQNILKEQSSIVVTRKDMIKWCDFTRDFSLVHRDQEAAKAFNFLNTKFRDTPIPGA